MTNKKTTYFKDIPDSLLLTARNISSIPYTEPRIRSNDILQVSILSLDPQANNIFTAANSASFPVQAASTSVPAASSPTAGVMVDNGGMIELPIIGKVKVMGLTTAEAREAIHDRVAAFYRDPVVNVRFVNFNITVLGEVTKPATYLVPNEKVSILDAIGMAGDMTIYGKRQNVLLLRDSMGQKQSVRFDLNSSKIFSSPYFYLKQGDVIYVEPGKAKVTATDGGLTTRVITIAGAALSLLIVYFSVPH